METTTNTTTEVRYRIIAEDELRVLAPLFSRLGWAMPDANMAKVLAAEAGEGNEAMILGLVVVQFVTHAEPLWVHPDLRGQGVAEGLMENVVHYIEHDCRISRYMAIAKTGSFGARLCERNGMVPFPGQVYVKQVAQVAQE